MRNSPIGIFDSGIGGLTVFREISKLFPHEDIVYFGDTARVPYGTKSHQTILRFALEDIDFLKSHKVKVIIAACNTASAVLSKLKKRFKIPVVTVIEPGVKEALSYSKNKRVGIIGTESTISSRAYEKVFKRLDPQVKIFSQACPLFVPLIEEDWINRPETGVIVRRYLSFLKGKKIDTLILGCTHYPLMKALIQKELGRKVKLIDSARAVAKELRNLSKKGKIELKDKGRANYKFYVSDLPLKFKKIGERFLGRKIDKIYIHRF